MRKLILISLLFIISVNAQVFNTAQTLKSNSVNIGLNPAVLDEDFGFFLHGGYGISPGFDLGLKLGLGLPETYFGADFEWVLRGISPFISVAAGGHSFGDIGLDGTLNFTFPINRQVHFYSGMDMDINFVEIEKVNSQTQNIEKETDTMIPLWLFVGTEIGFRKNMTILLEVEISLNADAYNIFGGGINFYL
jgi:hypothetical protein